MSAPFQYEHVPLYEICLRTMTAAPHTQITPALDTLRKLPLIQMSLADSYGASEKSRETALEILRQSVEAAPLCPPGFKRELPQIITGENQDWQLWCVEFYVARLRLCYVDKARLDSDTASRITNHSLLCGCAYLISPPSIGLNFLMPELGWRIEYEMISSSPTGSHSAKYKEIRHDKLEGDSKHNVPSVAKFIPPHL